MEDIQRPHTLNRVHRDSIGNTILLTSRQLLHLELIALARALCQSRSTSCLSDYGKGSLPIWLPGVIPNIVVTDVESACPEKAMSSRTSIDDDALSIGDDTSTQHDSSILEIHTNEVHVHILLNLFHDAMYNVASTVSR